MQFPTEISFIVGPNDKKGVEKRPDYRGEVTIGDATYELAAWKRVKKGTDRKFVSGVLKLKQAQQAEEPAQGFPSQSEPANPTSAENLDEDVPF
jgi:uncharacterized protein (DUF736 family)